MQKNILKLCKFISKDYIIKNEINKVLGTNNIQECRWFIEMDEWHDSKASVYNHIPTSITKS